jgi:predicted nucleic acid-binding protein
VVSAQPVYLVDTSAWVEYLRDTNSVTCNEVDRLYHERPNQVAITEPVVMELLAGPTDPRTVTQIEKLIGGLPLIPVDGLTDYRFAAAAFRAGRLGGNTVRSIVDCLIAAVAARTGANLVHQDRDFELLAAVLPDLRLHVRSAQ